MSDVQDGLEIGGSTEDLDVNTTAGFTAALAAQAGIELSEERINDLREQASGGLTTESAPGQSRDEQGRFAPTAPPAEEIPAEGTAPEGDEVDQVDPDVAALLEKHGGDATAALAAALKENQSAQEFQGRQSNEVGELREQLARLEGMIQGQQQQPPQGPPPVSYDVISDAVGERGGPQVINDLVHAGYQDGHPAYDQAFQAWADEPGEQGAASAAYTRYLVALSAAHGQQAPSEPDQNEKFVTGLRHQEEVDAMSKRVAAKHADFNDLPISEVFEDASTPAFITDALDSEDINVQEQALEAVIQLARARRGADVTVQAKQQVQEASRQTKLSAQVATGSLRPVPERQPETPEGPTKEEAIKSLQDRILGIANRTSVKDGLTFAK